MAKLEGKIKWGILGPGKIAEKFAGDFSDVDNAVLQAVGSRSIDRAKDFANRYKIPKAYGNYLELLNDPDVDAIYIATTHNFHKDQSIAAMEAGKAVLSEKPITTSEDELKQLISEWEKSDNYLAEGMWSYFLPAIKTARKWIEEGKIGKLLHIKADFGYHVPFDAESRMFNPELAGGALLDMGIYPIAMAWYFTNQDPKNIDVFARPASTGVDLDVTMLFRYEDLLANLATSFDSKLPNVCYLIGDEGTISIPDFWKAKSCFLHVGDELKDEYMDGRNAEGFNYEIQTVSQEILDGLRQSEVMPLSNSEAFQRHMDAVRKKFSF